MNERTTEGEEKSFHFNEVNSSSTIVRFQFWKRWSEEEERKRNLLIEMCIRLELCGCTCVLRAAFVSMEIQFSFHERNFLNGQSNVRHS